jgi:hypothetical protein
MGAVFWLPALSPSTSGIRLPSPLVGRLSLFVVIGAFPRAEEQRRSRIASQRVSGRPADRREPAASQRSSEAGANKLRGRKVPAAVLRRNPFHAGRAGMNSPRVKYFTSVCDRLPGIKWGMTRNGQLAWIVSGGSSDGLF